MKLTVEQQAQIMAILGKYPDREKLSGMHYAYCVSGVLTDMLTCDDEAYFDEIDVNIHADDFDITAHGELCCTEYLTKFGAVCDNMETVMQFAWPAAQAIHAAH